MTLTINLPSATVEKLQAEAVEVKLAVSGRSFRDIMAPVHDDFRRNGMGQEELDTLVDEAVAEARAARKDSRKQQ